MQNWVAAGSFAVVNLAWLHYLALIPREQVPRRPVVHTALMVAGAVGAVIAVLLGPGLATIALAAVTLPLAGLFLWLLSVATLPSSELLVRVGEALPPFGAVTADGEPWQSAALGGRRALFKLFRGHW